MKLFVWFLLLFLPSFEALTSNKNENHHRKESPAVVEETTTSNNENSIVSSRRNLLWKAPLGAVGAYAYGRLAYNAFSVRGIEYPEAHEQRVESTLAASLTAAAAVVVPPPRPLLRVLEVGIGTDCRLIRRGLYDKAVHQLSALTATSQLELTGLDFRLVPTDKNDGIKDAQRKLDSLGRQEGITIDFRTVDGSITAQQGFPDGYFDSILCCLTLCSVEDQTAALQEIKRLLRPAGGTFGYIEHVAADDDAHRFLELQQKVLDPLQQKLADNCHLHRYTEQAIASAFDLDGGKMRFLQQDRFYVNSMWPVSCQCCGVIQRI